MFRGDLKRIFEKRYGNDPDTISSFNPLLVVFRCSPAKKKYAFGSILSHCCFFVLQKLNELFFFPATDICQYNLKVTACKFR